MARKYELTGTLRLINALMSPLAKWGFGPDVLYVLTTTGRKSGQPRSTPVNVMPMNNERWIVSPYGEPEWVKNVRAGGEVRIRRGSQDEAIGLEEADAQTAAPVLQEYIRTTPITQPYFDVTPDSPQEALVAAAAKHPVCRVVAKENPKGSANA